MGEVIAFASIGLSLMLFATAYAVEGYKPRKKKNKAKSKWEIRQIGISPDARFKLITATKADPYAYLPKKLVLQCLTCGQVWNQPSLEVAKAIAESAKIKHDCDGVGWGIELEDLL